MEESRPTETRGLCFKLTAFGPDDEITRATLGAMRRDGETMDIPIERVESMFVELLQDGINRGNPL